MTKDEQRTWNDKYTIKEWWDFNTRLLVRQGKVDILGLFIDEGDLAFDIGSQRGEMTWSMRQLGARVIAVEPMHTAEPRLVPEFEWMFGDDEDVILVPYAIAPKPTVSFGVNQNWPELSSCSREWRKKSAHSKYYSEKSTYMKRVKAVTLDSLILEYGVPVFIKIDCEGYDSTVLSTLSTAVPSFSIEFHVDWLKDTEIALVHSNKLARYEYNYILDHQQKFGLYEWTNRLSLLRTLRATLEEKGPKSWGDIYARYKS